jgi:hypothetical protein
VGRVEDRRQKTSERKSWRRRRRRSRRERKEKEKIDGQKIYQWRAVLFKSATVRWLVKKSDMTCNWLNLKGEATIENILTMGCHTSDHFVRPASFRYFDRAVLSPSHEGQWNCLVGPLLTLCTRLLSPPWKSSSNTCAPMAFLSAGTSTNPTSLIRFLDWLRHRVQAPTTMQLTRPLGCLLLDVTIVYPI